MTDWIQRAVAGVQSLHPYQAGKPIEELEREYGVSNIIKLASNENPLGPSPLAQQAISGVVDELALYPDSNAFRLKRKLAAKLGVDSAQITVGNGSNDVLVLLAEILLSAGLNSVSSQFSFAIYALATQATGAEVRQVTALPSDHPVMPLGHDLPAMLAAIDEATRIVFIANPNNPTGTWLNQDQLQGFIDAVPPNIVVVIDEAYFEYAAAGLPNAMSWIARYPNLVVTRSFSKAYGLAGLRVGYAVSNPQLADLLNRIRQPFNANSIALAAAEAALDDDEFLNQSRQVNEAGLVQLRAGLQRLGLTVLPSAANFVLVDVAGPAGTVFESLLRQAIIVRPVANYGLPQHLRITVGTEDQNQRVLAAMAQALQ